MIVVILNSELTEYGPHPLGLFLYNQFQYKPPSQHTHILAQRSGKFVVGVDWQYEKKAGNVGGVLPSTAMTFTLWPMNKFWATKLFRLFGKLFHERPYLYLIPHLTLFNVVEIKLRHSFNCTTILSPLHKMHEVDS
jgi:hypothetical protein